MNILSIRDLRQNLAKIADRVAKGEGFLVMRRSRPAFKIVPVNAVTDEQWETVIDFTKDGALTGLPIEEFIDMTAPDHG